MRAEDYSPRVHQRNRRLSVLAAAALLGGSLTACGAKPAGSASGSASGVIGGLPDLHLANVKTETSAARGAMIKRGGGTLQATGSNGVVYTLTVPPGALAADTNVGLYPVASIESLVGNGGLIGGVQFTPDGTTLDFPATLSVEVPANIDLTHVAGFAYSGDAADPELRPAIVAGRTITIKVRHFSGIGASRTYGDLLGVWGGQAAWQQAIFQEIANPNRSMATIADILRTQYDDVVLPALGLCTNVEVAPFAAGAVCDLDGTKAAEAQWAYEEWRNALLYVQIQFSSFTVDPELGQSKVLAATHLHDWYGALNDRCRALAANPIVGDSAENPVRWAGLAFAHTLDWANEWGISTSANGLDLESLLDNLCAKVVIDPSRSYSAASPGDTGTLRLNAGITIETAPNTAGPVRHQLPIQVKVTGAAEDALGVTDSQGDYHVDLAWPDGLDPIKIDILASINVENPNVQRIARFDRITKSSGPGQIAWMSNPSGAFQIFSMQADGTATKAVTTGTGPLTQGWTPSWSSDGRRIAFYQGVVSSGANLMVVNADGSGLKLVVSDAAGGLLGRPSWSPDGAKLAFQAVDGHDSEIYVVGLDGSARMQLTSNEGEDGGPAWSPDGTRIAFTSVRDRNADVYVISTDGSGEIRLTTDPGSDGQPQWSPDGRRIVFASQRGGVNGIWVMQADGSGQMELAGGTGGAYPTWSPDGTQVVFAASASGKTTSDLFVMQADGTAVRQLTQNDVNDIYPSWSP